MQVIQKILEKILGTYNFDREAERIIKKSIKLHKSGNKINKLRAQRIWNKLCKNFNCSFPPYVKYGEGLYVSHCNGIIIGRTAIIGKRCKIYPHCTIVAALKGDEERKKTGARRHAKIGDDCILGAKSTIIGPINIGDDVTIAAGAIVTKDVPSHTVVKNVNEFRAKKKEEIPPIYITNPEVENI